MATHTEDKSGNHKKLVQLVNSGQFSEARKLATVITRKCPNDTHAWYMLAGIAAHQGNLDEVINCCMQVIRLRPDHAGAHFNLAAGLHQTGRLMEAATSYRRCLSIEPGNIQALMGLGKLLDIERDHDSALQLFEKAVAVDPGCSEAYYCIGVQFQAINKLRDAANAYRKAIRIRPGYIEASNNLGHTLTELGELNAALDIFRSLVNSKPDSPQFNNNLGVVYDSMGKAREAEEAYREAIAIDPALLDTRNHLGYLLSSEGRTREALEWFDSALDICPGHESSIAGKAAALEKLGKFDDAYATLLPVINNTTDNPDLVLAYCTLMLRKDDRDDAIKLANQLLASGNILPKGIVDLNFILGDLYEKEGNYPMAFQHYETANRISPCTYSHENHVRYIDSIINTTGKESIEALPKNRQTSRDIIFIVGMPRSGTSLVEQILASHADVFGAGELRYIGDIAASFSPPCAEGFCYPGNMTDLTRSNLDVLARRYIHPVEALADKSRLITDKMPHNFLYLGLISILFPYSRVIHVTRAPLDNCLSLYFHGFNSMHSYTTDMVLLGRYYLEYQRLMSHWKQTLNIPILEISYEDIVSDLENSTRELLGFCGLDWSMDCMKFHENDRFVKTPSYDQVRRPIYSSSVDRWQNYKEFIVPLKSALCRGKADQH